MRKVILGIICLALLALVLVGCSNTGQAYINGTSTDEIKNNLHVAGSVGIWMYPRSGQSLSVNGPSTFLGAVTIGNISGKSIVIDGENLAAYSYGSLSGSDQPTRLRANGAVLISTDQDNSKTSKAIKFYVGPESDANLRMIIDNNGKVGIGNPFPLVDLDVTGDASVSGALQAGNSINLGYPSGGNWYGLWTTKKIALIDNQSDSVEVSPVHIMLTNRTNNMAELTKDYVLLKGWKCGPKNTTNPTWTCTH